MCKYVVIRNNKHSIAVPIPDYLNDIVDISFVDSGDGLLAEGTIIYGNDLYYDSNMVFVKCKDYFRRVMLKDIMWIEADGSYCVINLSSGKKMEIPYSLSVVSERINSLLFCRVHRSFFVNLSFVDAFIGNSFCIGQKRIPISRRRRQDVLNRFNIIGINTI